MKSQISKPITYNLQPTTYNPQPFSGFTLIELLVAIAVIFIVIGITYASFASLNQKQHLVSSGQTMKNTIRDAQSRAYTGELDCSVCDCNTSTTQSLKGWYVNFSDRKIFGECVEKIEIGKPVQPTITFSPQLFNISSQITIVPHITPPASLKFINFPPAVSQKGAICLSQANLSGSFYVIRVNEAGDIYDDGGLQATCTP